LLACPSEMTGRTDSTHPKPLWRGVVRLLSPEPEGAANGGEHRGDRRLIQPGVLAGPRDGIASLLLPESLCKLPDAPTENCVAPIDDSHVPPFRCPSLPMHLRHKRRRHRWGTMIPTKKGPVGPDPGFLATTSEACSGGAGWYRRGPAAASSPSEPGSVSAEDAIAAPERDAQDGWP